MAAPRPARATSISISLVLGVIMLAFGLLKLVNPFATWYSAQIAGSGLPPLAHPAGIAAEVGTGLAFLGAWVLRRRLGPWLWAAWAAASAGVVVAMLVATYVHLQPGVPAAVLPLGIKPPLIPLSMLGFAVMNLAGLRRRYREAR